MDKGYGFISVEGQEKDLFFHFNELQGINFDDLREGDAVSFEITDGPKGPSATNVKRLAGGNADADEMESSDESDDDMEESEDADM